MVQDNRAAPPNTAQIEQADGDVEQATEDQMGELDEEGVAKLNAQIAKEQKEAKEFWEEERAKKVEASGGAAVADPLKPSSKDQENRKKDREDAAKKNEAARKERETEAKKAGEAAKKPGTATPATNTADKSAADKKAADEKAAAQTQNPGR